MATSALSLPFAEAGSILIDPRDPSRLGRKLGRHLALSAAERDALDRWLGRSVRLVRDRTTLVEEGAPPSEMHIVVDGWACRYRSVAGGGRQVVSILLPGDICDFNSFVMRRMDSTIEAVGDLRVACISRSALNDLTAAHPRLSQGLWWDSMVAAAIGREWLVNMGQRNARQRVAHLLCELYHRLEQVDLAADGEMPLPLTQADLGGACGMTPEHTNRTLRGLRDAGLIESQPRLLRLLDIEQLKDDAGFSPDYLHGAADFNH